MIGQTFSHYRIIERLGEGGMGVVYLAEDTLLGRRVAIKTLTDATGPGNQHFRTRFLREARAISGLSHPHIATIHDYGETPEGHPYIVMEFIRGETLADLMLKQSLTIPRALEIISEVAEALGEAHAHGIIHRDIKPSNVAINHRGEVKVLDFGLAKQIDLGPTNPSDPERQTLLNTQTREGVIVGTPMYLSPEQALGVDVDARSDLFSLGSILYECIAGKPPFTGDNPVEICARVIRDDPTPSSTLNSDVNKELDRITLKALAKKPEGRYQSANEMIADLRTAQANLRTQGSGPIITRLVSPAARTHATGALAHLSDIFKHQRISVGYVAAAVVLIVLIAFSAWLWIGGKPHRPTPEAQRLFDLGVAALREGAYYKASNFLTDAVHHDDKFALAHARLAEAFVELDYYDRAKEAVLRASALANSGDSMLSAQDSLYLQGINAVVLNDYGKALEYYTLIVRQVAPENRNSALLDLARTFERNEDFENAAKTYEEITKGAKEYATAILRLGVLSGRQQNVERAQGYFDQSERLFKEQGNSEGITEVHYQRGSLLSDLNRTAEARTELQQSLDLARNTTYNEYQVVKVLLQLSSVATTEGNVEQAKSWATQANELAAAKGMANLKTQGLIKMGNAFFAAREYVEATRYFKQAIESADSHKGLSNGARARLSLGSLYIQQEESIDDGLRLVEDALAFYQKGGYGRDLWQAMLLRGRARLQRGDYDGARQALDELLQHAQKNGDPSMVADTHFETGILLANQELYPQALEHFIESRNRYETRGNPVKTGYSWLYCGDMLWRLGRYDDANQALDKAESFATQIKALSIRIGLTKAQIELSQRKFPEAVTQAKQLLTLIGPSYKRTAIEVKCMLCSAQVLSGVSSGLNNCQEATDLALSYRDPHLFSNALLALAEAKFLYGDSNEAQQLAKQAIDRFNRAGQAESEWQANLTASRAFKKVNNMEAARSCVLRAEDLLKSLKARWGEPYFATYVAREDVRHSVQQLGWSPDIAR